MNDQDGYQPTTTHAEWGAGDPHLLVSRDDDRFVHHLVTDAVHVGSADGNELQLAETDPVHATIIHDDRDEYVLTLHGEGEMNANPRTTDTGVDHRTGGERSEVLRTGAHFTAGPWKLVFAREEFADHGRPYGGREGGEFDDQQPQPVRRDYAEGSEAADSELEVKDG